MEGLNANCWKLIRFQAAPNPILHAFQIKKKHKRTSPELHMERVTAKRQEIIQNTMEVAIFLVPTLFWTPFPVGVTFL